MSKPKTDAASNNGDPVTTSPELAKLEKAIKAEAGTAESPKTSSKESQKTDAPHGQAFQELAEKKGFKSVDDLAKAYQNAESSSSKMSQELSEIRKEIKQINAPQPDNPYDKLPPEQKQALDLLRTVVNEEINKNLKPIQEDFEVKKAGQQLQKVRDAFPGVSDSDLDRAITRKGQIPGLSLEDAVKIETYETARADGTNQRKRAAKTNDKKRAFVESAKTSKSSGEIDYSKLSLEEMEEILPIHGQFIDSKGVLRK